MKMRISAVIFIVLIYAGCMGNEPYKTGEFPRTLVDDVGREVSVPVKPERIISLAPSNTEILYSLGVGDKVVGTTSYCNYPEEATKTEKVGGFSDVNVEKVISLEPDIVFATTMNQKVVEKLQELGIAVVILDPVTLGDVLDDITLVGEAVGEVEKAETLRKDLEARIDAVKKNAPSRRPTVYIEGWVSPGGYGSFGSGSLVDDLITLAGGQNIAQSDSLYPSLSAEVILLENPDIIIIVSGMGAAGKEDLKERPGWDTMDAVKNDMIYIVDGDLLLRPGPRVVDALEVLADIIRNSVSVSGMVEIAQSEAGEVSS